MPEESVARSHNDTDNWTPRTFLDELVEKVAKPMSHGLMQTMGEPAPPEGSEGPEGPEEEDVWQSISDPNAVIECRCGVRRPLFAFVDVRPIPVEIRGSVQFVCDGCWIQWIRDGKLTEAEWLEYLGAPEQLIQQAREHPTFYSSSQT